MSFVTIISFDLPHQAHLAKVVLESEDIEVEILDELTVQVNNFYSNAIGGVKVQVDEKEVDKAFKILVEAGYLEQNLNELKPQLSWLDKFTNKLANIFESKKH